MSLPKYKALAAVACFMVLPASAGMVALYTFDNVSFLGENSGTAPLVWKEESGITATTGVFGGGGSFVEGVSSCWQRKFGFASTDLGAFSVSMHIRGAGVATKTYLSIGTQDFALCLEQTHTGSVAVLGVGDSSEPVVYTEGTSIVNDGCWHHIGLVSDGASITLYIDGVAEGIPSAYTGSGTITHLQLASRLREIRYQITADLDDVGIFDEVLTPADMAHFSSHMISESDSFPADGVLAYELVDPRFPSDRRPNPVEEWARWPRTRIRQLEVERNQLLEKISVFPLHHPISLSSQLGYHSLFEETGSSDALPLHQIEMSWAWDTVVDSIALAPAFNPKHPGRIYAFPKRFKIDVRGSKEGAFKTVVDWMEEDFPDPGMYPAFFAGINRRVMQMRITIPQVARESGMDYSALGEVYVLKGRPDGGMGENMAMWNVQVNASDSFSLPPLWDIKYLNDGLVGLGVPLSDEAVKSEDLRIVFEDGDASEEVQLLLDLGRVQRVGRIDFWPAAPPAGLALSSFGFPGDVSVELSREPSFKKVKVVHLKNGPMNRPHENISFITTQGYKARYVRVTVKELGEYKGKRILGLGEILVSEYEQVLSAHCKISAQGIPSAYLDQLPRLVDGCSWGRRILPQGEWIKGLAQRRPLDRRLTVVERELERARLDWLRMKHRLQIWAGGIVVLGLIGGLGAQRWIRKRGINKLKRSITRDLHDDVGSNLGSITLTAEKLKHADMTAEVRLVIDDLTLLAREAFSSLREVVWVVNEGTIRLPMLIQKLAERAERVLGAERVVVAISADCPDRIVPLTLKRHLAMLFKEMVHNCARHAQASQIWLDFIVSEQSLRISLRDDGCGFDTTAVSDGWGLESMAERAQEVGGTLNVESQVGEGTTVVLMIPLISLMREAEELYKTSN